VKHLRICIFTETYYPVVGGGETQAKLLAEELVANGHSALIVTRRSDKLLQKSEQYGEVRVYRLPPSGGGQLKKWGLLFSSLPMLVRLHRQYDLIFVSGFRIVGITAVLVSRLFSKKCILKADSQGEMSGLFFNDGLQKFGISPTWLPFQLFLKIRNKILAKADAFSAISSDIAKEFSSSGIDPNRIRVIPNSVDTSRFLPATHERKMALRRKLGLSPEATIVIYTGRLVSYKGLPLLLCVWRDICQKHKDVFLLLVGTGGLGIQNCEDELKSYTRENNLEQKVLFTGSVQNVPDYLQAADIFAFPTEEDAFPSSLIEAMACALPVVTTPVGAIKSIVKDGQNGMVIQPGDHQQLLEALDRLIRETRAAAQLGQSGLETVQAHYSTEIVTKEYLSLFHHTMNAPVAYLGNSPSKDNREDVGEKA
jgi:glycosyltransferase involved in cell wall biosynthesis